MALAKEERNRLFIGDWRGKGLTTEELGIKYDMSPGGVKALKQRLRQKDPSLYEKGPAKEKAEVTSTSTSTVTPEAPGKARPERKEKVTSASTSTLTSTSTKRMTFWLPSDIIREIKARAKRGKRTASDILREVLGEYLKNK